MKHPDSVKRTQISKATRMSPPRKCLAPTFSVASAVRRMFFAAAGLFALGSLHAQTNLLQFDDFNNRPVGGSLSTGDNEAASGWKNVSGLSDLSSAVEPGGGNWWDRTGATGGADQAPRIRYTSGQITTDNPMPLLALGATSVTMSWDYAPDSADYNVGLYYAAEADTDTTPLVLLDVNNGSRASAYQWLSDSVTITDGVDGVVFTDNARFVLKYHSGTNVGNPDDQWFDNIEISYEGVEDTTAPTPNLMTWAVVPQATGEDTITMTATTAVDDITGVEYFFEETSGNPGGDNSGWQASPEYADTGLMPNMTYTYTVKARDTSASLNETAPSTAESAATDPADTNAPPTPAFAALPAAAAAVTAITMSAEAVSDPEGHGVEYYFTETSGNPGGSDSGWQDALTYTDTGLQTGTLYSYTVKARDKSLGQNESAPSAAESATTGTPGPGDVLWRPAQNIIGPLDVATEGTLVYALTGDDAGGDVTVNGVTFTQGLILSNGGAGANFPFTGDPDMDALLTTISFGGGTIEIPDLIPGDEYLIQVFLADTRGDREMVLGDGNGNTVSLFSSPIGQQATATFIAEGTSKTFTITAAGGNTHLNAVQVRRLSEDSPLRITSFSHVGGDLYEVAIQGRSGTGYEFRSSPDLDFNPGTLVEFLTEGDPGDPGTISGDNGSLLVTDANGVGTARLTLTTPSHFIRALLPE